MRRDNRKIGIIICLVGLLYCFHCLDTFAEVPELKFKYYRVESNETFWKLFGDKWEIAARFNKIDIYHLSPGTILKIPLDWELAKEYPFFPEILQSENETPKLILVVIQEQFLAGYEYGQLKFWYPVCSGKEKGLTPDWALKDEEFPTPRGRYQVLYKDIDHKSSLYPKTEGGQPMPFTVAFTYTGHAFHAWGIPQNLRNWFEELVMKRTGQKVNWDDRYHSLIMPGWPDSHGCLRLFTEDAEKLFNWADSKTAVLIIDSIKKLPH